MEMLKLQIEIGHLMIWVTGFVRRKYLMTWFRREKLQQIVQKHSRLQKQKLRM